MNNNTLGLFLAGLAGYVIYAENKRIRAAEETKMTVNETASKLSEGIDVDISAEIVNEAIERAVNRQVQKAVDVACADAVKIITDDVHNQVKGTLTRSYDEIKYGVKLDLENQLGEVDISGIRNQVVNEARAVAAEKFKNDLDEVLEEYNAKLNDVGKIYRSIAETLNPSNKARSVSFSLD